MGDFEDVFGAGADADDIIDGYSRDYGRENHVGKANWFGNATSKQLAIAQEKDDRDKLYTRMRVRGYHPTEEFKTYKEVVLWDQSNTEPFIRVPFYDGWIVFQEKS